MNDRTANEGVLTRYWRRHPYQWRVFLVAFSPIGVMLCAVEFIVVPIIRSIRLHLRQGTRMAWREFIETYRDAWHRVSVPR